MTPVERLVLLGMITDYNERMIYLDRPERASLAKHDLIKLKSPAGVRFVTKAELEDEIGHI